MKHCILVKWNNLVEDKASVQEGAKNVFNELRKVSGIHDVIFRENCVDRDNRFDFLICIEMDESILPIYDASAPHHEWKEKYGKFVEKKAIFDFEE